MAARNGHSRLTRPPEEQEATPRVADHGYASPTPCTDGEKIYAAFGPSGVVCCSLDGKELWRTSIGTGVAGFGAAASPIVYGDLVYINAAIESEALVAIDKHTGEITWKVEDINRAWTTPTIVTPKSGTPELVMHHKELIRGYDPKTGEVLWTCRGFPITSCLASLLLTMSCIAPAADKIAQSPSKLAAEAM